ncbi:MAG: pseudouridine synthase [Bacteroidales bacterium]|nr:pseudouridine synthase [Bacteroidales bacterium]
MSMENDNWRDSSAEENERQYNREEDNTYRPRYGYESEERGYRPRFSSNTGSEGGYRPRFSNNAGNEDSYRPRFNNAGGNDTYRPRMNGGNTEGGYRPRFNNNGGGNDGYRPRTNGGNDEGGYRPRFNNNGGGNDGYRPRINGGSAEGGYRPRFNNNGGNDSGYGRPRFNNNGGSNDGYRRPRFNNNGGGNDGGYGRPRFNNNGGGNAGFGRPRFNNNGGGYGNQPQPLQPVRQQPRKKAVNKKKQINYKQEVIDPTEEVRLNKYLANAGICSRREADEFITAGVVTVNGQVITELGTKIKYGDEIKFHDQTISIERKIYILLNKPKDTVTTSDDPQSRRTVLDLVKGACPERIYPVGRLDRNTTGVLLLTNDGDLASKLTHPKFMKKKIYHVHLDKNLTRADMEKIATGLTLDDGEIHADAISYTDETKKDDIGIEIHSGKNRIVRRIFESLGYRVVKLDRVFFAGLTKKGLRRGEWRFLTEAEVNFLRMGSFE